MDTIRHYSVAVIATETGWVATVRMNGSELAREVRATRDDALRAGTQALLAAARAAEHEAQDLRDLAARLRRAELRALLLSDRAERTDDADLAAEVHRWKEDAP